MMEETDQLNRQLEAMKLMLQKSKERNDQLERMITLGQGGIEHGPSDASSSIFNPQSNQNSSTSNPSFTQPIHSPNPQEGEEFPEFAFPFLRGADTTENGASISSTPMIITLPKKKMTLGNPPPSINTHTPPNITFSTLAAAEEPQDPYDISFFDREKQKESYDAYERVHGRNQKISDGSMLERLNERLRIVEGGNEFEALDLSSLCLVPEVIFPAKFKTPEFTVFTEGQCSREHLHIYYRKMAAHRNNDKLMMYVFQDSLGKEAAKWYTQLDKNQVRTMQELADAFMKHYKESIYVAPDWLQLQKLSKSPTETFQQYADIWREMAINVRPAMAEKDLPKMFVDSLGPPYYAWLTGSIRHGFAEVVSIGRRYEEGLKLGKITSPESSTKIVRPTHSEKKEEQGVHAVVGNKSLYQPVRPFYPPQNHVYLPAYPQFFPQSSPNPYPITANTSNLAPPFHPRPTYQPRPTNSFRPRIIPPKNHTPIPISYTELVPMLIEDRKIVKIPARQLAPPYPPWYRENEKCDFHLGAPGHNTENCRFLKDRVQELLNSGMLKFGEEGKPDVNGNPLPTHGGINNA